MVVIRPSSTPKPSFNSTYTIGARQFVVQEALEITGCSFGSYLPSLTPITRVGQSPLAGAVITTFFAPATRWPLAFSTSVNSPVDSITTSTPNCFQGNWEGSLALTTNIFSPLTMSTSGSG